MYTFISILVNIVCLFVCLCDDILLYSFVIFSLFNYYYYYRCYRLRWIKMNILATNCGDYSSVAVRWGLTDWRHCAGLHIYIYIYISLKCSSAASRKSSFRQLHYRHSPVLWLPTSSASSHVLATPAWHSSRRRVRRMSELAASGHQSSAMKLYRLLNTRDAS